MNTVTDLTHNGELKPGELIELLNLADFNRLGEWKLNNIETILEQTDYYIAARRERRLVGFVRLLTDWHTQGYISHLCIHPSHRNLGIGQTLLCEILHVCDNAKICVTYVYDTSGRPGFYRRLGFLSDDTAMGLHRLRPNTQGEDH